jgi:hypothetical protein
MQLANWLLVKSSKGSFFQTDLRSYKKFQQKFAREGIFLKQLGQKFVPTEKVCA